MIGVYDTYNESGNASPFFGGIHDARGCLSRNRGKDHEWDVVCQWEVRVLANEGLKKERGLVSKQAHKSQDCGQNDPAS